MRPLDAGVPGLREAVYEAQPPEADEASERRDRRHQQRRQTSLPFGEGHVGVQTNTCPKSSQSSCEAFKDTG